MLKPVRQVLFVISVRQGLWSACLVATVLFAACPAQAQNGPVRVIAFGDILTIATSVLAASQPSTRRSAIK